MKKQNKTKQKNTLKKLPGRKVFLRSGDGQKVEAVTVAQKMRHAKDEARIRRFTLDPGGVLPYLGYTGTCRWIGYGFLASLS